MTRCITCRKPTNRNRAHVLIHWEGKQYLACCPLCQSEFEKDPWRYVDNRELKRRQR